MQFVLTGPNRCQQLVYGAQIAENQLVVARILWRDAQGKEGSVELGTTDARIGRAMDCAVRTDDAMVSRNHARICWHAGQHYVEDMGSANGVYYQEQRVTRHALKHGDAVRCGSLWLRYLDPSAAQPVVQQPAQRQPVPPQPKPQPVGQPPPASASNPDDAEEIRRLRRRIDQLQAELRMVRGGGAKAVKMEALEKDMAAVQAERDMYKRKVGELEGTLEEENADAKVKLAGEIRVKAQELVSELNDHLSNLRINVTAAQGEFEQFADKVPRASFELIREALRTAADDVGTTRELLREMRKMAT